VDGASTADQSPQGSDRAQQRRGQFGDGVRVSADRCCDEFVDAPLVVGPGCGGAGAVSFGRGGPAAFELRELLVEPGPGLGDRAVVAQPAEEAGLGRGEVGPAGRLLVERFRFDLRREVAQVGERRDREGHDGTQHTGEHRQPGIQLGLPPDRLRIAFSALVRRVAPAGAGGGPAVVLADLGLGAHAGDLAASPLLPVPPQLVPQRSACHRHPRRPLHQPRRTASTADPVIGRSRSVAGVPTAEVIGSVW
jgi:hypothetical protein